MFHAVLKQNFHRAVPHQVAAETGRGTFQAVKSPQDVLFKANTRQSRKETASSLPVSVEGPLFHVRVLLEGLRLPVALWLLAGPKGAAIGLLAQYLMGVLGVVGRVAEIEKEKRRQHRASIEDSE